MIDIPYGGNGGLSMRNKRVLMKLIHDLGNGQRSFGDDFRESIVQQDQSVPHYWKRHVHAAIFVLSGFFSRTNVVLWYGSS
jgi:hypothetical protein